MNCCTAWSCFLAEKPHKNTDEIEVLYLYTSGVLKAMEKGKDTVFFKDL